MHSAKLIGLLAACVALPAGLGATAAGDVAGAKMPQIVTKFAVGQFPESITFDGHGLFVSVTTWGPTQSSPNTGQVVRVTRTGKQIPFGPVFRVGFGLLTGVTTGPDGVLYLAVASNQGKDAAGVWRIGHNGEASRVLPLTDASFPNGIAFYRGRLYVTDSTLGRIWTTRSPGHAKVWFKSKLLKPASTQGLGANGITFRTGAAYVAVDESGRIVRIPVLKRGAAGSPTVIAHGKPLKGADGIQFDRRGALLIATSSSNTLLRLSPTGHLTRIAGQKDGLLYPVAPLLDTLHKPPRLYVLNGDFLAKGVPSLMKLR